MARIRSIHPGQATDDDFVEMSRDARLFALHLRCEADDQGVFEWKPKRLKMAIFPADDDVNIEAMLSELVANRQVQRFEFDGKSFGVIRNFRVWQRPKKPNAIHFLPAELRTYAGLHAPGSEPQAVSGPSGAEPEKEKGEVVPNQFPTGGEIPPQMEDGGGRMEEKELPGGSSKKPTDKSKRGTRIGDFRPDIDVAVGMGLSRQKAERQAERFVDHWRGVGGDRGVKLDWPATWRNWVRKEIDANPPPPRPSADNWRDDPVYQRGTAF